MVTYGNAITHRRAAKLIECIAGLKVQVKLGVVVHENAYTYQHAHVAGDPSRGSDVVTEEANFGGVS